MTTWDPEMLDALREEEYLRVAPFRADGTTYGTPTVIWGVLVDDELYIRPWNGEGSSWYQAATTQGGGRILVAGNPVEVRFAPADPTLFDAVDAAYRRKYSTSPYLDGMLALGPRETTLVVAPA